MTRVARRYTQADLAQLRVLAAEGASYAKMAIALGRSPGSISGTCAYYSIRIKGGGAPDSEFIDNVRRLAAEGLSRKAIAARLGKSLATVASVCNRYSIHTRTVHRDAVRIAAVKRWADAGLSRIEIAARLGIPIGTVRSDVYRNGIQTFGKPGRRRRAVGSKRPFA